MSSLEGSEIHVHVIQEFGQVFHAMAAGAEDYCFFLGHPLEKGEQQKKTLVTVADNITLFKGVNGAVFLGLVDVDV